MSDHNPVPSPQGSRAQLDASWRIVLAKTATPPQRHMAEELRTFLSEKLSLQVKLIDGPVNSAKAIILVSADQLPELFGTGLPPDLPSPASVSGSFVLSTTTDRILCHGRNSIASVYAAVHLLNRIQLHGAELPTECTVRSPFFYERAGGVSRGVQHMPPGYTEHDYARFLVRHFINFAGHHPGLPPISSSVAREAGFALLGEYSSNPFYNDFHGERDQQRLRLEQWGREEPGSVNEGVAGVQGYQKPPVLCIRSETGQVQYTQWLHQLLQEHPAIKYLVFSFGDWASACGDACPRHGQLSVAERVADWLAAMNELAKAQDSQLKIGGRTWYYDETFGKELIERTPRGISVRVKEPAPIDLPEPLGHTKYSDAWGDVLLYSTRLSENFGPVYLRGAEVRGDDFCATVGMGDTEESVGPLTGMATPWLVAAKLRRLAEQGVRSFNVWWGGMHGWTYSVNHEVIAEFTWDPFQDPDAAIASIARRDFGAQAEATQQVWRTIEEAFSRVRYITWKQQFETFLRRTGVVYEQALDPKNMTDENNWLHVMRPNAAALAASLAEALPIFDRAVVQARRLVAQIEGAAQRRAQDQLLWNGLLTCVFRSQYHILAALDLLNRQDPSAAHDALQSLARAEVENIDATLDFVRDPIVAPNFQLTKRCRTKEAVIEMLEQKRAATLAYANS